MDISLVDAYELTNTDWTQLNPKQKEYLDKIFAMAVKICILIDEPLSVLSIDSAEQFLEPAVWLVNRAGHNRTPSAFR